MQQRKKNGQNCPEEFLLPKYHTQKEAHDICSAWLAQANNKAKTFSLRGRQPPPDAPGEKKSIARHRWAENLTTTITVRVEMPIWLMYPDPKFHFLLSLCALRDTCRITSSPAEKGPSQT